MIDVLRKSFVCDGFFFKKLLQFWLDDYDECFGKGKQYVGDGVGVCVVECGNVVVCGIVDDFYCWGVGVGFYYGVEQYCLVYVQYVGVEQEVDYYWYQVDDKFCCQYLVVDGVQFVIDFGFGVEIDFGYKYYQIKFFYYVQCFLWDIVEGWVVGVQEVKYDVGEQQVGGVVDVEVEGVELEGDYVDYQVNDKEGVEGQQIGYLVVNGDKVDVVGYGFYVVGVVVDLQYVVFVQYDVIVDRYFDLVVNNLV